MDIPYEQMHDRYHAALTQWITRVVTQYRNRLGLEAQWRIDVEVSCTCHFLGGRRSVITWQEEVYEAVVVVACDGSRELLLYEVACCLVELSHYRTENMILDLAGHHLAGSDAQLAYADQWCESYRVARRQETERQVQQFLGSRRPPSISSSSPTPSNGLRAGTSRENGRASPTQGEVSSSVGLAQTQSEGENATNSSRYAHTLQVPPSERARMNPLNLPPDHVLYILSTLPPFFSPSSTVGDPQELGEEGPNTKESPPDE